MKEIVYHGSQNGDIKELTARMSTHKNFVYTQHLIKWLP